MRALVTGAAGFVGGHLVAHLVACGDEVVAVDRHDGPDLLDPAALTAFVADLAPDAVYHLAGWSDVGASWDEPLATFESNAVGTLNLLQACLAAAARAPAPGAVDQQRRRVRPGRAERAARSPRTRRCAR